MFVNQIDTIIDQILNRLFLEGLSQSSVFKKIVDGKKTDFVEFREEINDFIQKFMEKLDTNSIRRLISNKENLQKIIDIIKRYVAYYCFLYLAYHYSATIKEYRNNLIQYSKLQEQSQFQVKNFFDTENNFQIIRYYQIIKDVSQLILMTDLQKKAINISEMKAAIIFLNGLGQDYVNNYLLALITDPQGNSIVQVNVHNLIKTIVFGDIYRNQEQKIVFDIVQEISDTQNEYIYIDIVVSGDSMEDYESFRQLFLGKENIDLHARNLQELVMENLRPTSAFLESAEYKNSRLFDYQPLRLEGLAGYQMVYPIVEDFLRYHRDSERFDTEPDKQIILPQQNNAKNIQLALLYQQRKRKENTKIQIIVNKIDVISDLYSETVKSKPKIESEILKYFDNPQKHRRAVLFNYYSEARVMEKMRIQGRRVIEGNEYYLELYHAINNAYYNFKEFQKVGTGINLVTENPILMIRSSNIEFSTQASSSELDIRTGNYDVPTNIVGLAIGPVDRSKGPVQCVKKEGLINIRDISFKYIKDGQTIQTKTTNGYDMFLRLIKQFYIKTIVYKPKQLSKYSESTLTNDFTEIIRLNPDIASKVIYWTYDLEKDSYVMETYESTKTADFQENLRLMNATIYEQVTKSLKLRLQTLIRQHHHLPVIQIEDLIELFNRTYSLRLTQDEKSVFLIENYLKIRQADPVAIKELDTTPWPLPVYVEEKKPGIYKIMVNAINPIALTPYVVTSEPYSRKTDGFKITSRTKCQHEIEWSDAKKLKSDNLNKYNQAVTAFIEKFAIETSTLDFVCTVCGQILPLKQYLQDGSFDNSSQKFISSYVPVDIPLQEVREYRRYALTIKYLDSLTNRVSLQTGTNMFVGTNITVSQRRKTLIKNIIDLFLRNNQDKSSPSEDLFSKKYRIDSDLNSMFHFELEDSIFNFTPTGSETETSINRLKFNNILIYFILVFLLELNGVQILLMNYDNIGNIYTYLKFGSKLFGDLLIKTNVTDSDTARITDYPVLCYLIFLISYFLIRYNLWYYPSSNKNKFNPVISKIIIHSFVSLYNTIFINAGKARAKQNCQPNANPSDARQNCDYDHVYSLITSKLYTQLNTTFKDPTIINRLQQTHLRFSDKEKDTKIVQAKPSTIETYSIKQLPNKMMPYVSITFKIGYGLQFDIPANILYRAIETFTNVTNCETGDMHKWVNKGPDFQCIKCKKVSAETKLDLDLTDPTYYFTLHKIAKRRCLKGTIHKFVEKDGGKLVCTECGRQANDSYNPKELDELMKSINRMEDTHAQLRLKQHKQEEQQHIDEEKSELSILDKLRERYEKQSPTKTQTYNQYVEQFISLLEGVLGIDSNLATDKFPIYLKDDVYIISHSFDGSLFTEPIIMTQKDNVIHFKEAHPFFKSDVYYYSDKNSQKDVFYNAVTLQHLGYKETHKDYVPIANSNNYLRINSSVRRRLSEIGYESRYIDIRTAFNQNQRTSTDSDVDTNYYTILNSLINEHVIRTKLFVDKIITLIYKIKNYSGTTSGEQSLGYLKSNQDIEKILTKFSTIGDKIKLGEGHENTVFNDWGKIKGYMMHEPVDWTKTNVVFNKAALESSPKTLEENPTQTEILMHSYYVNTELINYYDTTSHLIMFYLLEQLTTILNLNSDRVIKTTICQLYIAIVDYFYKLHNMETYRNSLTIKRFDYIINASGFMVDMMKKGQGLQTEVEETPDEETDPISPDEDVELTQEERAEVLEDIQEEADALDVERDYFEEEYEDYNEGNDVE